MPRTKRKVKSIVKTKVISARVTETVHELLHRQAEDAGMTLSQFAAQMLMKGRVNTSYVFYVHPDEIEAITREFAAIGNNLNQIAAFFNSGGIQSRAIEKYLAEKDLNLTATLDAKVAYSDRREKDFIWRMMNHILMEIN